MRKYLLMVIGLLLTAVLFAACGGDDPTPTSAPATVAPPTLIPTTPVTSTVSTSTTAASTTPTLSAQPTSQGDATQGQILFMASCSACHGPNAEGVKGLGKDMTTSQFIASKSDPELLDFIKQGRPVTDPLNTTGVPMPAKGGNPSLTDEQLLDIIAYIRTVHK
ncbi:MAG: cytochrome c [Chloroflexi bacterium]|nr:cytochrome c [Chloroflexota bacterium]